MLEIYLCCCILDSPTYGRTMVFRVGYGLNSTAANYVMLGNLRNRHLSFLLCKLKMKMFTSESFSVN